MPGISLFNRRWNIGSDDFFYPNLVEFGIRTLWFLPQLFYYLTYKESFHCVQQDVLIVYYFGFLILMAINLVVIAILAIISSRGTILNDKPRRHLPVFIYLSILLRIFELGWNIVGIVWLGKTAWTNCSVAICLSVLANIVFSCSTVTGLLFVTFFIFDPLSNLNEKENDLAVNIEKLYKYLKKLHFLFCCFLNTKITKTNHYQNSYQQLSSLIATLFNKIHLVPTDILCGILLLSKSKTKLPKIESTQSNNINSENIPSWMSIEEARHFMKYALAIYSFIIHFYIHKIRIVSHLILIDFTKYFQFCFTKKKTDKAELNEFGPTIEGSSWFKWIYFRSFKHLAKIDDRDILYINFNNELFFVPFCILFDHEKKSVVVSIRGTLSLKDVVTDITGDESSIYINDELKYQPCHSGMQKTAQNILNKIQTYKLLEKAFQRHSDYNLLITGHSMGAAVACLLSIELRKEYPDVKCISFSPPSGLLSKEAVDWTRDFIMSVVLGDDIVPRLSIRSIHYLKFDIITELYKTLMPKHKILWKYTIANIRTKKENDNKTVTSINQSNDNSTSIFTIELESNRQNIDSKEQSHLTRELSLEDANFFNLDVLPSKEALVILEKLRKEVDDKYSNLQMPGNILHIYRSQPKRSKSFLISTIMDPFRSNLYDYNFKFTSQEDYKNILISSHLLIDHFPNNVFDALNYFGTNKAIQDVTVV